MYKLQPGDRVQLVATVPPIKHRPIGTCGMVECTDDEGLVHVHWDDGNRWPLIPGRDCWRPLNEPPGC